MAGYTWDKELHRIRNPYSKGYGDIDISSISDDHSIDVNTTIKPIDREDATAEIESGEVVLHPDGKMFRALGKKHIHGGTPVNLPENSFIFSKYKPLSIRKEDKELFKFKEGGKINTPADVIKREVNIEHHNRMIAIQGSDSHDDISKKSSELMLGKNFKKLGQVAFLQEEKKGFPQGLPEFSQGTAPLQNDDAESMEQQYKQGGFMELGGPYRGRTNKPYIYDPSYPAGYVPPVWGVWQGDQGSQFRDKFGTSNAAAPGVNLDELSDRFNYTGQKDNIEFQKYLYNHSPENRNKIDASHAFYGKPHIGNPADESYDGKFGIRWQPLMNEVTLRPGIRKKPVGQYSATPTPTGSGLTMDPNLTNPVAPPSTESSSMGTPEILPYEPNVPLSPDQMLSLAGSAYNAASINKYAPKRMQTSFTPVNLERINSQPYLNQINNQVQQAYGNNRLNNPIVGRAANSQVYGKSLDQVSQTLGSIDNQNRQISNQENMYNNQGINRTANQNVQLDNQYYNQVQAMNQNYDNESRFARNRLMDQYSQYKSSNDSLEMQLASQPTFGTIWVDPKTGKKVDTQGKDEQELYKLGLRKQAAPLYDYNAKRNSIYYTGAGLDLNNIPGNSNTTKDLLMQSLMQKYNSGNISPDELKTLGFMATGRSRR